MVSFLGIGRLNPSARGKSGFAPPVAEEATPLFPQRSKNARKSESPKHFSGTARWNKSLLLRQKEQLTRKGGVLFLIPKGDLNGSGVRKRAGGTFFPRPGLRRSAGQIPPTAPKKLSRQLTGELFDTQDSNQCAAREIMLRGRGRMTDRFIAEAVRPPNRPLRCPEAAAGSLCLP